MEAGPHLLDVVLRLAEVPVHGLVRGQVGTVVEVLERACNVEFTSGEGRLIGGPIRPAARASIRTKRVEGSRL